MNECTRLGEDCSCPDLVAPGDECLACKCDRLCSCPCHGGHAHAHRVNATKGEPVEAPPWMGDEDDPGEDLDTWDSCRLV